MDESVKGVIGQGSWGSVGPPGVALAEQTESGSLRTSGPLSEVPGTHVLRGLFSPCLFQEAFSAAVLVGNTTAGLPPPHPF